MRIGAMAALTVRNFDDDVVRALRIRAAEHGQSAEAEHREILR
jgi:plasmid stability protein